VPTQPPDLPERPTPTDPAQPSGLFPDAPEPVDPGDPVGDEAPDVAGQDEDVQEGPRSPDDGDATWNPSGLELARAVAASLARPGIGGRPGGRSDSAGRAGDRRSRSPRTTRTTRTTRSGAGPDDRDPQALDSTIGRLVNERGWTTDVAVAGALARWDHIVGPDIAAHCRAERYVDAELTVRADSTAWATQVRLLAPSLVRRLNEELGDGTVRRVIVVGPSAPSWQRGLRSVRDGRGPRDTYG
jgi:predicted nucleic acid-binding Zn ribbon protein